MSMLTSPKPLDGEVAARAAWTARISAAWRKSVERILEAGRPRIDAKAPALRRFRSARRRSHRVCRARHLRLGIAECTDRAAACAQRAVNMARRRDKRPSPSAFAGADLRRSTRAKSSARGWSGRVEAGFSINSEGIKNGQ